MEIEFDISTAVFLIVSNIIFLVATLSVEFLYHKLEDIWRVNLIKRGNPWNGFLDIGLFRRGLELLGWRKKKIAWVWILVTVVFASVLSLASFAGEAGVSTRVRDKVADSIIAYSQKGIPEADIASDCGSPIECRNIENTLRDLLNSGDFSALNLRASELGGIVGRSSDPIRVPSRSLPTDSFGNITFMSCLRFFKDSISNTSENLYAITCGDIERRHEVRARIVERQRFERKYDPNAQNMSDAEQGFFRRIWDSQQPIRPSGRFRSIIERATRHMDLSYYVDRNLSNPCEVILSGETEDGLDYFVFTCPLEDGKSAILGGVYEWFGYVDFDYMTVLLSTPGIDIRWEDVLDAMLEQSPGFVNVGLGDARGKTIVLRTLVYATMMSTRRSKVSTTKLDVVIVVSVWWVIVSATLLFLPIIIFGMLTLGYSLFMPKSIRHRKLTLPVTTSDVYKIFARAVALREGHTFGKNDRETYDFGLYEPDPGAARLHLGWTNQLHPLDERNIFVE